MEASEPEPGRWLLHMQPTAGEPIKYAEIRLVRQNGTPVYRVIARHGDHDPVELEPATTLFQAAENAHHFANQNPDNYWHHIPPGNRWGTTPIPKF